MVRPDAAESKQDYTCPACRGIVRLRCASSEYKQPHFFHLQTETGCGGESEEHYQAKLRLAEMVEQGFDWTWGCGHPGGHIQGRASLETQVDQYRIDVAVFDDAGKPLAFLEVLHTHAVDRTKAEFLELKAPVHEFLADSILDGTPLSDHRPKVCEPCQERRAKLEADVQRRMEEARAARQQGTQRAEPDVSETATSTDTYFSGRVHSVNYENPGNSFYILKMVLDAPSGNKALGVPVTVKGTISGLPVVPGAWFGFTAKWDYHEVHGKQLAIRRAPVLQGGWDADTALKMLGANGVGFLVIQSIRQHFLEDKDLLDALEDKAKLETVPGLTSFTAMFLVDRWTKVRAHFQALDHLSSAGVPASLVPGIWNHFGEDTHAILTRDPWSLVEVDGVTFAQADEVAKRSHLVNVSARIRGAALYVCKSNKTFGHLYLRTGHIHQTVGSYIGDVTQEQVTEALVGLHKEGLIYIDGKTRPGIKAVYEPMFYEAERQSAEMLMARVRQARFLEGSHRAQKYLHDLGNVGPKTRSAGLQGGSLEEVAKTAIEEWGEQAHLTLSEPQKQGILYALTTPVSVLSGLPGTGKCVVPSTLISGPWGMAPIGSVVPQAIPVGMFQDFSLDLDTSSGVRAGTAVYNGGFAETVKIVTRDGFTLEGTSEHPIRVVGDGKHVWKTLGEIQSGDVPVLFRGERTFGSDVGMPDPPKMGPRGKSYTFPSKMTPDIARILGYLVSEGSVISDSCWSISAHDSRVQDYLMGAFEREFGYTPSRHYDKRVGSCVGVRIGARQILRWFRCLGVMPVGALEKAVPHRVLTASRSSVRAFLQALYEGDGAAVSRDLVIEYGTSSAVLAHQVQTVLLGFGIVSTCHSRKTQRAPGYRVLVAGWDYTVFQEKIGYHFTDLPGHSGRYNPNRDVIYGAEGLIHEIMCEVRPRKGTAYNKFYRYTLTGKNSRKPSRKQALWMVQQSQGSKASQDLTALCAPEFYYSPVVSVMSGHSQVWDFSVPDGHEFLSNGFISHNTTSLKAAVRILQDAGVPFLLAAPTGIAAKNLSARTGALASTIHRAFAAKGSSERRASGYTGILGTASASPMVVGGEEGWGYGPENPHPADVVIIDEASMMDQYLLFKLLECTRPDARLVFVGDHAQLPSVGPGNVLRDLISSGLFPTVKLTQIFRQEDTSGIVYAAHAIHAGRVPDINKDFKLLLLKTEDEVQEAVLKIATRFKAENRNFQILSPKHNGTVGVTALNTRLRELLNPASPGRAEVRQGDDLIRQGDRIMIVQNDYKRDIFNGDVGKVSEVDRSKKVVGVTIYGDMPQVVEIDFKDMGKLLRLAYACTVHKCVAEGTLIATRKGLVPIEKLVPQGSKGPRRLHSVIHEVAGAEGWAYTDQVFEGEVEATVRIRTRLGYALEGSYRHPVMTLTPEGEFRWKTLPDVAVGDVLVLRKGTADPKGAFLSTGAFPEDRGRGRQGILPDVVSSELAWLLGVLVGDGNQTDKEDARIEVSQRDGAFRSDVARLWGSLFNIQATVHRRGVYVHARTVREFLAWCGLGYDKALTKRVPWVILESPPEVQGAFLRGLFDTDGGVSRLIHLTTTSGRLASEVQQMLLHLGIVSGKVLLRESLPEKGWAPAYRVQVTGSSDSALFEQLVGFSVPAKVQALHCRVRGGSRSKSNVGEIPCSAQWARELRDALRQRGGRNYPEAPKVGKVLSAAIRGVNPLRISHLPWLYREVPDLNVLHPMLFKVLECGWFFDPVQDVSEGKSRVLDVHVPSGHTFVGGGFVNHNSQGLEYDYIVMPLVTGFYHQLQRNLLYTAITRARKQVCLLGHYEALEKAVANAKEDERATLFLDRLLHGATTSPEA